MAGDEAGSDVDMAALVITTDDGSVTVTGDRVSVWSGDRIKLDVPMSGLRRVELVLEDRLRPGLIIVPHRHEPQLLMLPLNQLSAAAHAMRLIGERIAAAG